MRSTVKSTPIVRAVSEEPKTVVFSPPAVNVPTCSAITSSSFVAAAPSATVDTGHIEPGPSAQHITQPVVSPRPSILRKNREPGHAFHFLFKCHVAR